MTIGENIKKYRKKMGITQRELAEKCGYATGTIQQYELNKRKPNIETIKSIAKALGVLPGDLIRDESWLISLELVTIKQRLKEYTDNPMLQKEADEAERILEELNKCKQALPLLETLKPGETVQTTDIRENKLLSDYRQLNGSGRMEAIKRVEELTEIKRYTEPDEPPAE